VLRQRNGRFTGNPQIVPEIERFGESTRDVIDAQGENCVLVIYGYFKHRPSLV
jgi:hypothetical protein